MKRLYFIGISATAKKCISKYKEATKESLNADKCFKKVNIKKGKAIMSRKS